MAYFSKGHNIDDDGDDFDEYDPTPYGGGYDIHLTYGHPLPASDDICHPPSQNYSDEAAEYTSYADVSGYDNDDAIYNEYSSYTRYGSAAARKTQNEEEEQEEVVDEYVAERTEFEEPSYERSEEQDQESEAYGRSEEDEYGGRNKYVSFSLSQIIYFYYCLVLLLYFWSRYGEIWVECSLIMLSTDLIYIDSITNTLDQEGEDHLDYQIWFSELDILLRFLLIPRFIENRCYKHTY